MRNKKSRLRDAQPAYEHPEPLIFEPPAAEPPASKPPASEPPASEPPAWEPPASEPPPPFALPGTAAAAPQFLTPTDPSFAAAMATSYANFVHERADALPAEFHRRFRECLHGIQSAGLLARHDIIQPMGVGTRLAKTRVTRCLIGKPGITYKYLGVRMFAHPWGGQACAPACAAMRELSGQLEERAGAHGGERNSFNLVLLNRMAPEARHAAKQERDYGMGPVSTISVYVAHHPRADDNFTLPSSPPQPPRSRPWRVALRVVHDAEGPTMRAAHGALGERDRTTPAVLLPLHDGDAYHMLGAFNHHHQHAVIQPDPRGGDADGGGGEVRYSSTHRVAVEEGETFGSVRRRALRALAASEAADPAQWREEQACLDALEFEWLRQWYVQGAAHRDAHGWWVPKVAALEQLWLALERLTCVRVRAALAGTDPARAAASSDEALALLRDALARRQRLRGAWAERERDALFDGLDAGYAPLPCLHAAAPHKGTLPAELSATVDQLAEALAARRRAASGGAARKRKQPPTESQGAPSPRPAQPQQPQPQPQPWPQRTLDVTPSGPEPPPLAPPEAPLAPPEAARAPAADPLCVEEELLRREGLRALRLAFAARCRAVRAAKGGVLSCFSKWHFSMLRRTANAAGAGGDPLLPSSVLPAADLAALASCVAAELSDDGFARADAEALAAWLHAEWHKAAAKLRKRRALLQRGAHAATSAVQLRPHASKRGLLDVVHPDATLTLSAQRLQTLRALYDATAAGRHAGADAAGGGEEAGEGGGEGGGEGEARFRRALLAMLLRYQALDGGGFQCAVPPAVFDCLRRQWGVACEGFASPLNCTLDPSSPPLGACRFCSAFPDVDARFGSAGSFFDVATASGSFQLNPPFSAELYVALLARCQERLARAEAARQPLSYALIIGATAPALRLPCVAALPQSAHFRGKLLVGVADHVYVCGRQHMKADAAVFRACDTGVYFLQTSAAAARWPVTDAKLARLRAAFEATNSK